MKYAGNIKFHYLMKNECARVFFVYAEKELFPASKPAWHRANDGASNIAGVEVIQSIGLETILTDKEIFVPINNIAIFSDVLEQNDIPCGQVVLLMDTSIEPEKMYISRLQELKNLGV